MTDIRIEFPCDYPIKVIGEATPDFIEEVLAIAQRHDSRLVPDKISHKASRDGNYTSVTLQLWATGEGQLSRLFADLQQCTAVRLVL